MTWTVVTPDGEGGTEAALVERPCVVEFGRIIGSFDTLRNALRASTAVNFLDLASRPEVDTAGQTPSLAGRSTSGQASSPRRRAHV